LKISEQQALLESLTQKSTDLAARIARLNARKEADERQWSLKSAELVSEFGTDDLAKIKEILEKEKADNEAKLLACQTQLQEAEKQVLSMEAALAELDAVS